MVVRTVFDAMEILIDDGETDWDGVLFFQEYPDKVEYTT